MTERVQSGIPGMDEIIGGGFPKSATILISGGCGTGKTIFAQQFLYEGAIKYNEAGLFVTIESNVQNIVWNMESFGWDIHGLQEKGIFSIYRINLHIAEDPLKFIEAELNAITKIVETKKIKRLVIDSVSALGMMLESNHAAIRTFLFKFIDNLKELDCTTLLVTETKNILNSYSFYGVEEFVVDGVVALYFFPPHRYLFIRKMRATSHTKNIQTFDITKNAIIVNSKDQILWSILKDNSV